jgi:fatty acid desaturase
LRRRFADAFRPRPAIYWCDLAASAGTGWGAFALSCATSGLVGALALVVSTLALYRAALLIHELAHLRPGAVPGYEAAWNLVVGFPLMVPSVMYVGSHADHHKRSCYGTAADPEYEVIAQWSPLRLVASTLLMLVLPAALAFRWGVLGPLSRAIPPLRGPVVGSMSTLVINPAYRRPRPSGRLAARWALCELGGALYFWAGALALATGRAPIAWGLRWYVVGCGILVLNHLRTLVAHRYESLGERLDGIGQLLDTMNVRGIPGLTALAAPVGLRYHGLHHLLPALPYHSLGGVHRALLAELPDHSAYRATEERTLAGALRGLWLRAARNARARAGLTRPRLSEARAAATPERARAIPRASDVGAASR